MSKAMQTAKEIFNTAQELGWNIEVRRNNSLLTITKRINGMDEFVTADMEYYSILGLLPVSRPGSMWGTDGGGVGAISAMNTGVFTMNLSGGNKRVLKALANMV